MANQPPPSRPWFRLPSLVRPAPEPAATSTPEPAPPQPRPPLARPAFRPVAQPAPPATQPQGPTPAIPPPAVASVPGGGVASVPTSPAPRPSAPSASLPTSPAPTTTVVAPVTTSASVPSSPRPRVSAPTSSLPSSPSPKPAPSSSVPTSPASKPVPTPPAPKTAPITSSVPTAMTTTTARVPIPEPSPRTIKPSVQSPPQSPTPKPTAPPPSPLILPPAKIRADAGSEDKIPLEAEQKTVLVQKTIDKPKPWLNGGDSGRNLVDAVKTSISQHGKQEPSKDGETKEKGQRKKISEHGGMRVITIAGENKGAFMEAIRSPNKKHVFEGNQWGSYSSSSSSGEGKPKMDNGHKGRTMAYPPMSAFINSNVQGVNSSIMHDSSCTLHDPGVHLAITRKPAGGGFHIKDHGNEH
ncbi:hypothetical protein P3X46_003576 [Hevea brasiliensis]|uniref:Uncharacterized protein n=1 Tax=Hevea brasiliensis TaxID=3981 RepID=A0ABQ9N7I5_HEVBR|nr:vegetative cell wall protein gp1 [Hevea brasiliensis]KAJ9188189.1 hypothetical protein P3X46_003576 [Hevea brasiliensis]